MDLTEGNFRNVLQASFLLSSLRYLSMRTYLSHGVNWNELGRNYRCFCQQGIEVSIYDLLDCRTDEEQVTLLTLLDYSNTIRNM
jgi:hypothetical protein